MTDLTQLRAERDAARRELARWIGEYRLGTCAYPDKALDALLKLEGDVRVAEACEALETESRTAKLPVRQYAFAACTQFLRARLTANPVSGSPIPEETGR